jgi:wyosine [tRNA(Phe)-imidazoG37] synthetase (radical SAM superfamily)
MWGWIMNKNGYRYIYGPVPSRRLGRSLGIDLVPFKTCTYDCVYCQLGRTTHKTIDRREYVPVADVVEELQEKLAVGEAPDYISLAGSGEPTLNSGIGDLIGRIKELTSIPVAILTNGSLLWTSEVREALMMADLVLPSLDAGNSRLFQYVNRPHEDIGFERMVEGIAEFTEGFTGEVWLEVFLLAGVTGTFAEVKRIAAVAERIKTTRIQLNTVSRPPSKQSAFPIYTYRLHALKGIFKGKVEVIRENEWDDVRAFAPSNDLETDILALLGRRPCTSEDVATGLRIHITEAIKFLEALIDTGEVTTVATGGRNFYAVTKPDRDRE